MHYDVAKELIGIARQRPGGYLDWGGYIAGIRIRTIQEVWLRRHGAKVESSS